MLKRTFEIQTSRYIASSLCSSIKLFVLFMKRQVAFILHVCIGRLEVVLDVLPFGDHPF